MALVASKHMPTVQAMDLSIILSAYMKKVQHPGIAASSSAQMIRAPTARKNDTNE